jgi:hypothetical protein
MLSSRVISYLLDYVTAGPQSMFRGSQVISLNLRDGFAAGCAARALPRRQMVLDLGCALVRALSHMNENLHLCFLPGLSAALYVGRESN